MSVAKKLITSHLQSGRLQAGEEIAIHIDQTLTQDATGTMVMLELEAMELDRVRTEVSVQYVDHNLLQIDYKNPDDHLFLYDSCRRYGIWYSKPGNGVSHPVHQEFFGKPGKTMLGSDSHTPAAGAIGMLAIGAGGLEVALAMAGQPFHVKMPKVCGVRLQGELPPMVSAKDVVLEMLRRHGVRGGKNKIYEYFGPGLASLSAMDRHVVANMGTELGATTTVFPSDDEVRRFLRRHDREADWQELVADESDFDEIEDIDLGSIEPMIALPSSPGNVKKVAEVDHDEEIYQVYIGSSANPGYRDFAVASEMVKGQQAKPQVSMDLNPASREILLSMAKEGHLAQLVAAGGRLHQTGCNGCIGMGQAPATGKLSLRTVPRNFPGRSGTPEDRVCLVSPETAAASALTGHITDPRQFSIDPERIREPARSPHDYNLFVAPLGPDEAARVEPRKGPNIGTMPELEPLTDRQASQVALKVGDDISTDEILPAGGKALPLRSNIDKISDFTFSQVDETYVSRVKASDERHIIVGGDNYGQGSSREHAALAPRYLGLSLVLAKSFARIHWQNLINFGVLPLTFADSDDYDQIEPDDVLAWDQLYEQLGSGQTVQLENQTKSTTLSLNHDLSPRQIEVLKAGSLFAVMRDALKSKS
jgi:aconitate hydratase